MTAVARKRGTPVQVYLSDAEAAALDALRRAAGCSASEMLRRLIVTACHDTATPLPVVMKPAEEERARFEAMPTEELRAEVDAALLAFQACPDPVERKRLQLAHFRAASVLGPRLRAAFAAAYEARMKGQPSTR